MSTPGNGSRAPYLALAARTRVHRVHSAAECAAARAALASAALVGIDTEWGTDERAGCALVQLAAQGQVWLVDFAHDGEAAQVSFREEASSAGDAGGDARRAKVSLLRWLFARGECDCVGWSFACDCAELDKMASGLGAAAGAATCDLQRQMRGEHGQLGLTVAAERLLGAPLDKVRSSFLLFAQFFISFVCSILHSFVFAPFFILLFELLGAPARSDGAVQYVGAPPPARGADRVRCARCCRAHRSRPRVVRCGVNERRKSPDGPSTTVGIPATSR
jgi:hypothetical protein